ncbi:MAG: hypothetical protein L0219_14215 [Phycisphaerales bacterium]|nr:hypothetical protein [Phycisphaerales bacterium]MCI0676448.1 hypothetical protein [Phycisphaerales bacterium]
MATSYIPAQDAQALIWMQTFSQGITANPGLYMLTAADAAAISAAVAAFDVALDVASDPTTRTPVSVATKDDARTAAEQICRQFVNLIKYNAGISDPDKIAIGVRPVNPNRDPIPAPSTSPLVNVVLATPGAMTLRYADSTTPDSPAKPFGATELQLFVAVGTTPAVDPVAAKFYGKFTKNPVGVGFSSPDDGKIATYFARWASRKGDTGPWSLPVSMRIAA